MTLISRLNRALIYDLSYYRSLRRAFRPDRAPINFRARTGKDNETRMAHHVVWWFKYSIDLDDGPTTAPAGVAMVRVTCKVEARVIFLAFHETMCCDVA
jgi:hypothetical protein